MLALHFCFALRNLLLTRVAPDTLGGIPALVYALSEQGTATLDIFGGRGAAGFVQGASSTFLRRRYPEVSTQEFTGSGGGERWRDEDFGVVPVLLGGAAAPPEGGGAPGGLIF